MWLVCTLAVCLQRTGAHTPVRQRGPAWLLHFMWKVSFPPHGKAPSFRESPLLPHTDQLFGHLSSQNLCPLLKLLSFVKGWFNFLSLFSICFLQPNPFTLSRAWRMQKHLMEVRHFLSVPSLVLRAKIAAGLWMESQ